MNANDLSKNMMAALLQDAYHYALAANGNDWSEFISQEGTKDFWMFKAIKTAGAAGLEFGNLFRRAGLPQTIASYAAARGINAYRGTVVDGSPESILADTMGLKK